MPQINVVAWVIGIAPAIIAIVALYVDGRRNRIALQTQLLLHLNEQWCSDEIKMLRRRVAQNLLRKRSPNYELGELLDFISVICYLYQDKAVNVNCIATQFGWWIVRYWLCAKEWVSNIRAVDPEGWKTFELVAGKLMLLDERRGSMPPSDQELCYFLKVESQLFAMKARAPQPSLRRAVTA